MGEHACQEASKGSALPPPATFAKADRGPVLVISVPIGSGSVTRFDNQTCSFSLVLRRTRSFGLHPNSPWPPSSSRLGAGVRSSSSSHDPVGQPSRLCHRVSPCQRSGRRKSYFAFAGERARRNIRLINRMSWL